MLCCCFVAEFRLVQFDSCDQQAFSEGLFHTPQTLKSLHCLSFWSVSTWGCRADVFETEQVLLESRGEFLVSARVLDLLQVELFHTFLMSQDVCDEVCL